MATHKVPQDVEAEDKLIGFLSLKQFIFTILGLGFGYLTFFFFTRVHPVTALIWVLPTFVFFVLGLYQRKDQPVEVYLASALRFYLKPHKRKWDQEGFEERVIITAPPKIEHQYTKSFSGQEATGHLTNLSRLMDSRGWTSKMVGEWQNPTLALAAASDDRLVQPQDIPSMNPTGYGQQPVDVQDAVNSRIAQTFDSKIQQAENATHQQAIKRLQRAREGGEDSITNDISRSTPAPSYQVYPEMRQKTVQPQPVAAAAPPTPPSVPVPETTAQPAVQPAAPTPVPVPPQPASIPAAEPPVAPPSRPKPQAQAVDEGVEISLH